MMRQVTATSAYCNLEDVRLFGFGPADFPAFISVLEERTPRGGALFLDEIQEVPDWQRLVRSLLDRGWNVCLTGSNASLLGGDLGAKLTGRHLSYEIFPFSYGETLTASGERPGAASFVDYLDHGGFPGYLRDRNPQVLQELLRDIVQRDIAVRHGVRETRHIMNLVLFLMANTGQAISLQSLTKALGIPTVAQTSRLSQYLQDAYLLFALPRYSPSFKKRVVAPNKYYAVDNGLRRAVSPHSTIDLGHRLENAVFLALRQRGEPVFHAGEKDLWECDFVTDREAIQACAELTPYNQEREIAGLLRARLLPGKLAKKRRLLLLTISQRDSLTIDGVTVDVRPAWEWLAEA